MSSGLIFSGKTRLDSPKIMEFSKKSFLLRLKKISARLTHANCSFITALCHYSLFTQQARVNTYASCFRSYWWNRHRVMASLPMMANSRWRCKVHLARGKGALVANDPGCFRMQSMRPHRRKAGWNYAGTRSHKIRHQRNSILGVIPLLNNTASLLTIIIWRSA